MVRVHLSNGLQCIKRSVNTLWLWLLLLLLLWLGICTTLLHALKDVLAMEHLILSLEERIKVSMVAAVEAVHHEDTIVLKEVPTCLVLVLL